MDLLILLAAMLPMPLLVIGGYLLIQRRRQHKGRQKRRKIRL